MVYHDQEDGRFVGNNGTYILGYTAWYTRKVGWLDVVFKRKFVPLTGMEWNDICVFSENLSRKFKLYWNLTRIMGTSREDQFTFMIVSLSGPLRARNYSDKCFRENQTAHFVFNNRFCKLCLYDIKWKNIVELDRPQITIKYGTCALYAGWLRLQTHTQNM